VNARQLYIRTFYSAHHLEDFRISVSIAHGTKAFPGWTSSTPKVLAQLQTTGDPGVSDDRMYNKSADEAHSMPDPAQDRGQLAESCEPAPPSALYPAGKQHVSTVHGILTGVISCGGRRERATAGSARRARVEYWRLTAGQMKEGAAGARERVEGEPAAGTVAVAGRPRKCLTEDARFLRGRTAPERAQVRETFPALVCDVALGGENPPRRPSGRRGNPHTTHFAENIPPVPPDKSLIPLTLPIIPIEKRSRQGRFPWRFSSAGDASSRHGSPREINGPQST